MTDFPRIGIFSECDNTDDAMRYAGDLAGSAGATAAGVMFNTVMGALERREAVHKEAERVMGVAMSCGSHSTDSTEVKEFIEDHRLGIFFDFRWCEFLQQWEIELTLDQFAIDRIKVKHY